MQASKNDAQRPIGCVEKALRTANRLCFDARGQQSKATIRCSSTNARRYLTLHMTYSNFQSFETRQRSR